MLVGWVLLYVHRNHGPVYIQVHDTNSRLIRDGSPARTATSTFTQLPNKPAVSVMDLCIYRSMVSVDVKQHSANQHSGNVSVIG